MPRPPAKRQRRFRVRHATGVPLPEQRQPRWAPARPERLAAALAELRTLQDEYETWCDQMPVSWPMRGRQNLSTRSATSIRPEALRSQLSHPAHDAHAGIPPVAIRNETQNAQPVRRHGPADL